jgi:hypothetical protein
MASSRSWLALAAGSLISWSLFTLSTTLLFTSSLAITALGGSCASGGSYSIEVECPEAVAVFVPLSIFGGLASVAIALFLCAEFGVSLIELAWSIFFVSLGGAFLYSFVTAGDIIGLVIGIGSVVMGAVPLVFLARFGVRELLRGRVNIRGERFIVANDRSRLLRRTKPQVEATAEPKVTDWVLSLGIFVIAVFSGYTLAELLYASAGSW